MQETTASEAWQKKAGQSWVEQQERMDVQLQALGQVGIERLAPATAERILDVGCGTGQTTLELAKRVGPSGRVVGLDISEPMLNTARARAMAAQLEQVECLLADAATVALGEGFDALFSRFGVMFFDAPVAAFRNLHQCLATSGRLVFVCWQPLELNEWASVPLAAVQALAPNQAMPPLLDATKPGPFYFSEPAFIRDVLSQAGFREIEITPHEASSHFGAAATVAEAADYAMLIGPSARFIAETEPELKPQFHAALTRAFEPYLTAKGVWLPARTFVVAAIAS
jgi:ubiquinone/menaquinone biosynthesis C-methylase UbiE